MTWGLCLGCGVFHLLRFKPFLCFGCANIGMDLTFGLPPLTPQETVQADRVWRQRHPVAL